jgi:hypothetical protein
MIYSKALGDIFIAKLTNKSGMVNTKFHSKDEILEDIRNHKKDIYFEMFINKTRQAKLFNFLFSYSLSHLLPYLTRWYSPLYHEIREDESEIIKKIKALEFIDYYVKTGNYIEAYKNLKHLGNELGYLVSLNSTLCQMAKNELMVDLLDSHIIN